MNEPLMMLIEDDIAIITFNNPPANVWTLESLKGLKELVVDLEKNKTLRGIIITGQGEKFFSAGADLNIFAKNNGEFSRPMADAFGEAFETLSAFKGVTIAAINGYAMGGGLECALACDIRIVEEHAKMALPEAAVGLLPCAGGTQLLPHLVSETWAKKMILLGERVDAKTAEKIGLAEEVVAKGQALNTAKTLISKVKKLSPESIKYCKQLIQLSRSEPLAGGFSKERDMIVDLFQFENTSEGVNAFIEKRTPRWK